MARPAKPDADQIRLSKDIIQRYQIAVAESAEKTCLRAMVEAVLTGKRRPIKPTKKVEVSA